MRDETIGASTRSLVQFYRESKIKAEKYRSVVHQSNSKEGPAIKYDPNDETENIVSKVTVVHKSVNIGDSLSNGYVHEDLLIEKYDLNDLKPTSAPEDHDHNMIESISAPPSAGLGAMYSKEKSNQLHAVLPSQNTTKSSFGDIYTDRDLGDSSRPLTREQPKIRPQPSRKNDVATQHAKSFFEKAKAALDKVELLKLNKLLVAMKAHGDEKNELEYVKVAKELMSVLVDSRVNTTRIQLISSLFPLLPIKYRYKLEKMAAALVLDKSSLSIQCNDLLHEGELSSIRKYLLPLIFMQAASVDAVSDRAFLEDSQQILTVLIQNEVNLQHLYDLLPSRQLMRVRALAVEMERSRDVVKAKQRSAGFKGEGCVNTALFQPAGKPSVVPIAVGQNLTEDIESQRIMTQALRQGLDVNRQRKDRMNEPKMKIEAAATHSDPYHRAALKESMKRNQLSVRNTNKYTAARVPQTNLNAPLDIIDECLNQVKSDGYVKPTSKLDRINGKIKAHVPKGMTCVVCNETLDQPLMAESCRHSACFNCWRTWLQRSSTCPTCRAPTTMKDLSKLVFTSETGEAAPTLTQICASDDEAESDDEELEIVITS